MNDSGLVYINGNFVPAAEAMVSVFDRGFIFGDSVYEMIPVRGGRIMRLQRHLQRLHNSLKAVAIECNMTDAQWRQILQQLLQDNGYQQCSMYLQVTRGVDFQRNHAKQPESTTVFAACLKGGSPPQQGVKVSTADDIRWRRCDIKTTCLLPNVMLRRQAAAADCYEMLLVRDGLLTEGAVSNVFMVNQTDEVLTPSLASNILPGVTRQLLLQALVSAGIPCMETDIEAASLKQAKELWLTTSSGGVMPIIEIDGHVISDGRPGPMWQRAVQHLEQMEQEVTAAEAK